MCPAGVDVRASPRLGPCVHLVGTPLPRHFVRTSEDEPRILLSRILVVEDSPDCLQAFKRLLQLTGHEVECARDGAEALALMESFCPDRLVTDLTMPMMDGLKLIEAIRQGGGRFARLPIVVHTAWCSPQTERRLRELGVIAIHVKGDPDIQALLRSVQGSAGADPGAAIAAV